MEKSIDPKRFGLHPSTCIEESAQNHFTLVMNRKSRIIMKDGQKIVTRYEKIRAAVEDAVIDVRTTAPVCSKTKAFLKEKGITITQESPS